MALLLDELSVWDISFRWSGYDPDNFWPLYPLLVKDNFRLLMEAILKGEIICSTLCLDKRPPESKADPRYYIRTYIDDIYACIHGHKYNRHLLKWATLGRMDFFEWCSCRGISPPEFWFPPGWKLDFDDEALHPGFVVRHEEPDENGSVHFSYHWPKPDEEETDNAPETKSKPTLEDQSPSRPNSLARIACQQIAVAIWKKEPARTIASVVRDNLIQEYGGGKYYEDETVREWVKVVAPPEVRQKRGRPRKENGDEEE